MSPKDRKKRFEVIAATGCAVCRLTSGICTAPHIHHAVGIKYRATGKKAKDEHTYGLCPFHHTGPMGIHHLGLRAFENMFFSQEYLLEYTNHLIDQYMSLN